MKKMSRIDIIGQNGNDGLHYDGERLVEAIPYAHFNTGKKLSEDKDVHHPEHYCKGGIETKDYMIAKYGEQAWYEYCTLNAMKYLSRYRDKGTPLQDLAKCRQYIDWMIDYLTFGKKP